MNDESVEGTTDRPVEESDEGKQSRTRTSVAMKTAVWILAAATVGGWITAGIALGETADLRKEIERQNERQNEQLLSLVTLVATGPEDVQTWIDTGRVQVPPPKAEEIELPLGCFGGDRVVWSLFGGLSC